MLETRKPTASPRIRPADVPRRLPTARSSGAASPDAASSGTAAGRATRSAGNTALRREPDAAPRPSPISRPNRLGRSEMRLMGLATVCTAMVCGLLLLYLAAYAHVTRLGIDQAAARGQLRHNRLQNQMLLAERDRLQSPQRIIAAASALGMTARGATPVEYISAPTLSPVSSAAQSGSRLASVSGLADQETHGGTTEDNGTAAPFDH